MSLKCEISGFPFQAMRMGLPAEVQVELSLKSVGAASENHLGRRVLGHPGGQASWVKLPSQLKY